MDNTYVYSTIKFNMQTPIFELVRFYSDYLKVENLGDKTIKNYAHYLTKFLSLYEKFNQENINLFLQMHNDKTARASIKAFIRFMKFNKSKAETFNQNLEEVLSIDLPQIRGRERMKIPKVLTHKQVMDIALAFKNKKHRLMFLISYEGALRMSELLGIRLGDINFSKFSEDKSKRGEITVFGKGRKEGIALIKPSLFLELHAWLMTQRLTESDRAKPIWKMKKSAWSKTVHTYSNKALGYRINTHLIRHTKATHLIEEGLDIIYVKEILRHANISTTQLYTHITKSALARQLDRIHEFMSKEKEEEDEELEEEEKEDEVESVGEVEVKPEIKPEVKEEIKPKPIIKKIWNPI